MSMNNNRIAIVEVGGSHDECILTQLNALKSGGKEVVLICTGDVEERNAHFKPLVDAVRIIETENRSKKEQAKDVWKAIKESNAAKVMFNTAQGAVIRNVCLKALFSKEEFIGIIHTTRKFDGSFTQKLISLKIKKYLLLSQFLHGKIDAPKGVLTDYFYPIAFNKKNQAAVDINNPTVVILGGVEKRRKDLEGFLKMLSQQSEDKLSFIFLGKSDPAHEDVIEFKKNLKASGLDGRVKLYDHFVSQQAFDEALSKASLILPLVHPSTPSADQYFKNQISGATNVAFGYKIPLLIHEAYAHIKEMNSGSFYYSIENFKDVLNKALEQREEKVAALKRDFRVEEQEKRYFNFIFG